VTSAQLTAVANHLWQSTLFAVLIALLTLLLRPHRARIRYALWLAASLKFLVPFALLTAVAARMPWLLAVGATVTDVIPAAGQLTLDIAPFSTPDAAVVPVIDHATRLDLLRSALAVLWGLGTLVVAVHWGTRWVVLRRMVRESTEIPSAFLVPIRSCASQIEPAVVGVLRPVLLLPAGIAQRLLPEELRAVLAHERCHVQRKDNLGAACHMLVEALFWFHPVIWWLGARLIHERERACDEHVLASGHAPERYAEGILKICEHYLTARLPSASAVSGANLKERIAWILKNPSIVRLGVFRRLVITLSLGLTLAAPLALGVGAGWESYETSIGGLKSIVWGHRENIVLNTDTAIHVRSARSRCEIVLERGEALFWTPHGAPLKVTAGDTIFRSDGGAFSVRLHQDHRLEVIVKEGRVMADPINPSRSGTQAPSRLRLSAFDSATILNGVAHVQHVASETMVRALAWTAGRIWFDRVTLAEATAEFNRYNRRQLRIDDPAIAALRIGGAFDATDLASFVAALTTFGITAQSDSKGSAAERGAIRLSARGARR